MGRPSDDLHGKVSPDATDDLFFHPSDVGPRHATDWLQRLAGQTEAKGAFICDLSTGAYMLSDAAADMHRLGPAARGIMDIVCAYEDEAREAVLATLEQVTGRPTMFAYGRGAPTGMTRPPSSASDGPWPMPAGARIF